MCPGAWRVVCRRKVGQPGRQKAESSPAATGRQPASCDREKRDMVLTSDEIVAANRESWNEAAARHRAHAQYAALLAGFATPGFSALDAPLNARPLGPRPPRTRASPPSRHTSPRTLPVKTPT